MTIEEHMTAAEPVSNNAAGHSTIAPLWKRVVAYFLDWILLAVVGMCIGFFLFDALAGIGIWGGAIGFVTAMIYFGICDSRIRNGQSVGKIAMKIRVVSRSGAPLRVPPAFLRAAILLVPYFLIGIPFDLVAHFWSGILLSMLIFGTAFGLAYLLLFNRTTRRSLHDLAVGSTVVRADDKTSGVPVAHPLWRGHIVAVVLLFVVAAILPVLGAQLTKKEPFVSLLALQTLLSAEPGVVHVNVTDGATTRLNGKDTAKPVKTLSIQVAVQSKTLYEEAFADKIARIALDNHIAANDKDLIVVTVSYGYDIGIASAQTSKIFTHSPADWRTRLETQK
jgi:uncharacterized RDD family membrane protein YckC